ncbi:MAG: ExeM/NucH family extracellular endonuclease [Micrococcales bacterium]|nr:ExeM/NucH family extracellular endonuclease [Micrococcales bacterium]
MFRVPLRRLVTGVAAGALVAAVPVVLTPSAASADPAPDLFFSEYVEGSGNNKAVEVYNGTGAAVDLTAGGYVIDVYANGGTTARSIPLTGTVAPEDVTVVANGSAGAAVLAVADITSGNASWNGNDAVVLRKGTTVLDVIGQVGNDPGTEWGTGLTSTADNTLRRKDTICAGDPNGADAFDPSVEWNGFAQDTFAGLGSHTAGCGGTATDTAPEVTSTTPTEGGSVTSRQRIGVTFSEPVTPDAGALSLSCSESGAVAVTTAGGPTSFTGTPASALANGESCTMTVAAAAVHDVDPIDPPDSPAADTTVHFSVASQCGQTFTPTYDIQGSGSSAAITGDVATQGVVVADYEGPQPALRGFYLQDPTGDGDPATSDALFVFDGGADDVSVGDLVRVTGTAGDYQDQTQVTATSTEVCGTGSVTPTPVALPMASPDAFERYEGMLVTFPQQLTVTEHYLLGRFGQVTLSSGGRLQQPTNVVEPGAAANALQAQNDLNQILLDDTSQAQNPDPIIWGRGGHPLTAENTLRGGDTTTGATGVLTYTWGGNSASPNAYRLRPVTADGAGIEFTAANPRPTGPPDVGGDVQVVGMNLLNYFNTLDTAPNACRGGVSGPAVDCRGAETQAELDRQTAKTVAAMKLMDADVYGVNEIENDGYGPDSAISTLVDALNAAVGAGTYAFVDVDANTGQTDAMGDDAIKVGLVYKPAVVTPVGATAALNTPEFVTGGDPDPRNRPSLAQAWKVNATGGVFVTDVNHLKSKGSACSAPDTGDGQGNCAVVRTNAVKTLMSWLDSDPTGTGDTDVLLIGDYNSYAKETPIRTLEGGGFTNLVEKYQGEDAYSYVFDGQWGYLDQALGSASLVGQVTGVGDVHINSDEPSVLDYNTNFKSPAQVSSLYAPDAYRVSDHDPVMVGLSPRGPLGVSASFADGSVSCGRDNASLKVSVANPDAATAVTVDWGDGTTTTRENVSGDVTLGHTYRTAGRHTATVTVTDSTGATASSTAEVVVEYRLDVVPSGSRTLTLPRGITIPVVALVRDCDGWPPHGVTAPVVTLTGPGGEAYRGTLRAVGPLWLGAVPTRGLARGEYTLTVTLPSTGQSEQGTIRLR